MVHANSNGGMQEDCVLFAGSGCTSAINKLLCILGLNGYEKLSSQRLQKVIVFLGPYEHHSNMLPWRECGAEVVTIPENDDGLIDVSALERKLKVSSGYTLKIGCFSAASNITGILTETNEISALLHKHGALSFWDYAAAAPYVKMDMNPIIRGEDRHLVYKDAIFFRATNLLAGQACLVC